MPSIVRPAATPSNTRNPFVPFIESAISYDTALAEKQDGTFHFALEGSLDDPDRVLLDAREDAKREILLSPRRADLVSKQSILENYERLHDLSPEDGKIRVRQMVMSRVPQFVRAPLESLSPSMC
jgi:hypothetical protein